MFPGPRRASQAQRVVVLVPQVVRAATPAWVSNSSKEEANGCWLAQVPAHVSAVVGMIRRLLPLEQGARLLCARVQMVA